MTLQPSFAAKYLTMHRCLSEYITFRSNLFLLIAFTLFILPIPWVIGWFAAVVLHEIGHLIALRLMSVDIESVDISATGVIISTTPLSVGEELVCALAGPAFALTGLLILHTFPYLAVCVIVQSAYNLFPIFPLDGGRAIKCIIQMALGERVATKVLRILSIFFLVFLAGLGLYCTIYTRLGVLLLLVAIVLCVKMKNPLQTR